jgi:hypothetical protein
MGKRSALSRAEEPAKRFSPLPSADAVITMYEAMIGRLMTQEQKIPMRAKFAALEARRVSAKSGPKKDFEGWTSTRASRASRAV